MWNFFLHKYFFTKNIFWKKYSRETFSRRDSSCTEILAFARKFMTLDLSISHMGVSWLVSTLWPPSGGSLCHLRKYSSEGRDSRVSPPQGGWGVGGYRGVSYVEFGDIKKWPLVHEILHVFATRWARRKYGMTDIDFWLHYFAQKVCFFVIKDRRLLFFTHFLTF